MDRRIVPAGAGGYASRLLHAKPDLDPLQPASLPILATLRTGCWRHGGTLSCGSEALTAADLRFIRAPFRFADVVVQQSRWQSSVGSLGCGSRGPAVCGCSPSAARRQLAPDGVHNVYGDTVRLDQILLGIGGASPRCAHPLQP